MALETETREALRAAILEAVRDVAVVEGETTVIVSADDLMRRLTPGQVRKALDLDLLERQPDSHSFVVCP